MDVSPRSPATAAPGRTVSMIANANCWSGHDRNALNKISFEKPSELKKVTSHKTFNKLPIRSKKRMVLESILLEYMYNGCDWPCTGSQKFLELL